MRRINFNKLIYKCSQCGNHWNPRKAKPKECPKCKSSDWFKPKNKKITVPSTTTKTITKTTTTTTGQIGLKTNALGIPIPEANFEIKKEVVKTD